ncbi:class I SAM-dependent methyltransferase [Actinomadura flavalba]|uniref:class I SAM-dependent methyltransferase n=1 Tax=Actinomadura flavalba TaxID=1120938 RepID=UPI0003656F65|nr:methyltransferase domain-containing protein [Actinomadura flavalba]
MPARPPEPTRSTGLRDASGDAEPLALYWAFYWAVAEAQLVRWLPRRPARLLDVSGDTGRTAGQAAACGHRVIEVIEAAPEEGRADAEPPPGQDGHGGPDGDGARDGGAFTGARPGGSVRRVVADSGRLDFLADASVDAVVAENRALSRHLVTEASVAEIARVLRPGGRVLLSVDSLTLGMALLAEQNRWAHLSDVPAAEVLLVPWPDGSITRCFGIDQLRELLTEAGLDVEWIRPRTALSPSTVEHMLSRSPGALQGLVRTELAAPPGDDSLGVHLLASARRPAD